MIQVCVPVHFILHKNRSKFSNNSFQVLLVWRQSDQSKTMSPICDIILPKFKKKNPFHHCLKLNQGCCLIRGWGGVGVKWMGKNSQV